MNKRDLVSGAFWMIFGAVFAIGGFQIGLSWQGLPGPGILPFIMGLICVGLSLVVMLNAFKQSQVSFKDFFPHNGAVRKLGLIMLMAWGYCFLLKRLGFVLLTFIFLFFVLRLVGREKWITAFVFSLLVAGFSYFLFSLLQVELPEGILGI